VDKIKARTLLLCHDLRRHGFAMILDVIRASLGRHGFAMIKKIDFRNNNLIDFRDSGDEL
jgi:hypothetical protein